MKYLLLFRLEDKVWDRMPEEEAVRIRAGCDAYDEGLRKDGRLKFVQRLESADKATTVRVRAGKMSYTDGPFAEAKECVAGLIVLEAADLTEALTVAAQSPLAGLGSVEVRPAL
jgi:hypothetical protein